jgi:hypothetical protein
LQLFYATFVGVLTLLKAAVGAASDDYSEERN